MNKDQVRSQLTVYFAAGGPIALLLMKHFNIGADEFALWQQIIIMVGPALISGAIELWKNSNLSKIIGIGKMNNEEKAQAFAQAPADIKVQAAASTPGVTVVVDTHAAPLSAVAVANDREHPNVVPNNGG